MYSVVSTTKMKSARLARIWLKYDGDFSVFELCQEVEDMKFLAKNKIPDTAPEFLSLIEKYGEGSPIFVLR